MRAHRSCERPTSAPVGLADRRGRSLDRTRLPGVQSRRTIVRCRVPRDGSLSPRAGRPTNAVIDSVFGGRSRTEHSLSVVAPEAAERPLEQLETTRARLAVARTKA